MRCLACGAVLGGATLALASSSPSSAQPPLGDTFDERLVLRSLPDGKLHALFTFDLFSSNPTAPLVSVESPNLELRESSLFPVSLAELVDRYGVGGFGASLSRGRWQAERWGWPEDAPQDLNVSASSPSSGGRRRRSKARGRPSGGEVWAWLDEAGGTTESEDDLLDAPTAPAPLLRSWRRLTFALSGLLCASLSEMAQSSITTFPPPLLHPPSPHLPSSVPHSLVRGLLAIEHPCTENLSPLLRMLPCGGQAGLASLLDPHTLFEANWQSLSLEVVRRGEQGLDGIEASIEVEVVFDPVRRDASAGGPGKRGKSNQSSRDARLGAMR